MKNPYNLICVLGATATGKTSLAVALARKLSAEIISADSRQIYNSMDIGTGKDLAEYGTVPVHLIDIKEAGYEYNVFEYQKDFLNVFQQLEQEGKIPVLCGGSGLYLEAVLNNYQLYEVPPNTQLRAELADKSLEELGQLLANYKKMHNQSDLDTVKRAIRAIEIADYYQHHKLKALKMPQLNPLVVGIRYEVADRRKRITERLHARLEEGMLAEVEALLAKGLPPEKLIYYGLEYKYLTLYLTQKLTYDEMLNQLNTAIHQFAKRQMTWFRRMERNGTQIHWLEGHLPLDEKVAQTLSLYQKLS